MLNYILKVPRHYIDHSMVRQSPKVFVPTPLPSDWHHDTIVQYTVEISTASENGQADSTIWPYSCEVTDWPRLDDLL